MPFMASLLFEYLIEVLIFLYLYFSSIYIRNSSTFSKYSRFLEISSAWSIKHSLQ